MELKSALFALLVVSLLVGDAAAIKWKFWKKDKDATTTTTASPVITNPQPAKTSTTPVTPTRRTTPNTNKAIAGAADPGLAVGVGNTGGNIRQNAQPNRPNPGTQVGQDGPGLTPNKPAVGGNTGKGYRDWAVDLTGAGEPGGQPPKLPNQGPAVAAGGQQQPSPGSRPGTPTGVTPGSPQGQRPGQPIGGQQQPTTPRTTPRTPTTAGPGQQGGQSHPGQAAVTPGPQGSSTGGKPQVSTLNIGSLSPGNKPGTPVASPTGNAGESRPGSPGSPTPAPAQSRPGSPGGKSWAAVAAENSRPGSPTSSQGGGAQPGQTTPGQTRPGQQVPVQPYGQTGHAGSQQPGRAGTPAGSTVAGGTVASTAFSKNPTYSKGNTVTDEDLRKLSESLFLKDVNNANQYITLNLQKKISSSSSVDEAPQPLLTVKPEALQIPTIQKVIAMYDNYVLDVKTNEYVSPAERQEESVLIDTFLSTNVMSAAMRFLADKGFIRKDYYDYKDALRRIWFTQYSRGEGKIGSSGFEHVFLTEVKLGTEVSGLHNWIYFNAEEIKKKIDYYGYTKKVDLGDKAAIVQVHLKFDGIDKPSASIFIGTSPELEMALYTVCFYTRRDKDCPVSLGGTQFIIKTFNFRYRGKDLLGHASPRI